MNEQLKTLITPQNLLSYTKACMDVANVLIDLKAENYRRIIIPSRGAYPFYNGALTTLHIMFSGIEVFQFNSWFNIWLLPFTADWNNTEIAIASKQIRKFWAKILTDSIRKETTPFTNYYDGLVDLAAERFTVNPSELKLDKFYKEDKADDEKFIFIDTAISGRAICEVIEGFLDFNLTDFHIIMIADDNGESIRSEYRAVIEREKAAGRLTQLNVEKIFSEDTSPLLNSGIASLVFPTLMETAYNDIAAFREGGFTGGGIWFIDAVSQLRDTNPNINGIKGVMHIAIYMGINQHLGNNNIWFSDMVEDSVRQIEKRAEELDIFDPASTRRLVGHRMRTRGVTRNDITDVTPSHVIRMNVDPRDIHDLIQRARRF